MKFYIGIDAGSSSAKFVLMDESGTVLSEHQEEYSFLQSEHGWSEIDPDIWFQAAVSGIPVLMRDFDSQQVSAIGITGQMHTTVFLDQDGSSIRNALMWNDMRTQDLIPELKALYATIPDTKESASILSTGNPAVNLIWLKKNEPQNYDRLRHFLIGHSYLVYRFSGKYTADFCEASTSALFDWNTRNWSAPIRNALGLSPAVYPEILSSCATAGTILPELARQLNLNPATKILVGTGDNPASAHSAGCFKNHCPVLSLGTSGVLISPTRNDVSDAKGKPVLFSADLQNFFLLMQGTVQSCGSDINWWFKKILCQESFSYTESSHLNSSLLFFPHLSGDKTIYQDPSLQGAFLGLSTSTDRNEMSKAVLEGLSFAVRQLFTEMKLDAAPGHRLVVIGGGSENQEWMQILSDVLNMQILKPQHQISAAHGVAILAVQTEAVLPAIPENTYAHYFPSSENVRHYSAKYKQYLRIYNALKTVYY